MFKISTRTTQSNEKAQLIFKLGQCVFVSFRMIYVLIVIVLSLAMPSCRNKLNTKPISYSGNYNRDFNDLNDMHLKSAKKIGISPISSKEEVEAAKEKLECVESTDTYTVEKLTHSIPYLVPQALDLLDKIGKNFKDTLNHLGAPNYKLIVTSVTRTKNDIKSLRKSNGNSSENSAHMYATTFDISWKRFETDGRGKGSLSPEQLKKILAIVLWNLKKEQACYVKHERKQGCFHITVR